MDLSSTINRVSFRIMYPVLNDPRPRRYASMHHSTACLNVIPSAAWLQLSAQRSRTTRYIATRRGSKSSCFICPLQNLSRKKPQSQTGNTNRYRRRIASSAGDRIEDKDDGELGRTKSRSSSLLPLSSGTLRKVVPFMYPQLSNILRGWFCTSVAVACLYVLVPKIGRLSSILSQGNLPELGRNVILVVMIVGVRSVAQFWQQAFLWEAALNITFKVRSHVFQSVLNRDMGFFEGQRAAAGGDIAFRVTSEAEDMGDTIFSLLHVSLCYFIWLFFLKLVLSSGVAYSMETGEQTTRRVVCVIIMSVGRSLGAAPGPEVMMVPSSLQLVAMATRMITLNPILALATFSVVPCMGIVIAMLGERLRKLARKGQDSIANLSAYLNEVLPSMFVVKAHAAEDLEQWRFERLAWAERDAQLGKKRMKAFIPEMITLIYVITAVVLFGVGTWAISKGTFDGGGMVSFITSLVLLIEPMQALGKAYNELKNGEPAIERLFELAHHQPEVLTFEESIPLVNVAGEVQLSNVSFRYSDQLPWVLNDVSLHVHPGETVALVGGSGGGKTTLAKLLLRLYDPVHGCITIDGQDIRSVSRKTLRQHVAIVPQETTLFTGTVAENISYGTLPEEVDMKAVVRAAELANADEFIRKLSHCYSTKLGDRASSLSGGQRQRLAIARAIYQEATILILDEATSALDNKSEKVVREALQRLMVGRTVFVIAHRLETVERADRIVVLDGGRIVEEGTHEALLTQGGKYAALYTRQESSRRPVTEILSG